jgi:hypothetical protein
MKILRFLVENVKGIRVLFFDALGDLITLSGKNGAGKSAALDAIEAVLVGGPLPVRNGESRAKVEIQLGEYTLTRTVTDKTDRFIVKNRDGATYPSPRKFLSDIVGPIAIRPLAFASLKTKEQLDVLFGLLPELKEGLDVAEKRISEIKQTRSDLLRDQNRLKVELEKAPAEDPGSEVDIKTLTDQLAAAMQENRIRAERRSAAHRKEDDLHHLGTDKEAVTKEIREINTRLETLQKKIAAMTEREKTLSAEIAAAIDAPEDIDTDQIARAIDDAEDHNRKVRAMAQIREKRVLLDQLAGKFSAAGDDLKEAEADKAMLLRTALMPIDGLGVTEGAVTYKGIPVSDLSTSEKVRVGAAIAVAQNPKARVILCDDISLLDSKSLATLHEICAGFQIWQVVNDESGTKGFYIEDGTIKESEKTAENVLKFPEVGEN